MKSYINDNSLPDGKSFLFAGFKTLFLARFSLSNLGKGLSPFIKNDTHSQSGNVLALLFGAVALTGVLAATSMEIVVGPVQTITRVTQKNMADTQMMTNAKLVVMEAATQPDNRDTDGDGFVEPIEYIPNGASGCSITFTGGGCLPSTMGAALTDPYGRAYAYCVWDHGSTDNGHSDASPSSPYRLQGTTSQANPVIAMISGGRDQTFQTSCAAFDGSGDEGIVKPTGSDDWVFTYTYAEATAASSGLWQLKSGDPNTAEISKDLEVKDASNAITASISRTTGVGDFLGITTDIIAAKTGGTIELDGNVGIGTTSPQAELHIKRVGGSARIEIDRDESQFGYFEYSTNGSRRWHVGISNSPETGTNAGSHFYINRADDTGAYIDTPFWISRTSGNIGIGVTNPIVKLDVGATDNTNEGGEIKLRGAASYRDWGIDVYQDRLRFFSTNQASGAGFAQRLTIDDTFGNVGVGNASPDASAQLDVSATDKGFLPPRLTSSQRGSIASPATGLMIYNTDDDELQFYDGSGWESVGSGVSGGGGSVQSTKFVAIPTPQNIRLTCNTTRNELDIASPGVPANAVAVIANIYTFDDQRNDHVNHNFGRNVSYTGTTWDNLPYTQNTYMNDVMITHDGEGSPSGGDYYGNAHGTQIIPLKSNGRFDARLCTGYSRGTHYITIQPYAYFIPSGGTNGTVTSAMPVIVRATGLGPNDGRDSGAISGRTLAINKTYSDTAIKLSYTDNFRTYISNKACRWEILANGSSCPSGALIYDYYSDTGSGDNDHRSQTIEGLCEGLPVGSHTVTITVNNSPGYSGSDCYTGWNNSRWTIEAEEVVISSDGSTASPVTPGTSVWDTAGNAAHYTAGNVGIGTSSPATPAALDVSSTTKGFLPPRLTTTQRNSIASPVAGLMVYNTDINIPQFYNGATWVSMGGIIIGSSASNPGLSCKHILDSGASVGSGQYWIDTDSTGPRPAFQVTCDMVTDGGGYTHYAVASGMTTSRSTDNNTCKTLGMDIVVPRTQAHLNHLFTTYSASYFAAVPGIIKTTSGGNYTTCIMRDPSSYGTGCADWQAIDGGRWWLRNSTYSEPNGDYTANCWLDVRNTNAADFQFNDGSCGVSTSSYICSTNDKP